MSKTHDLVCSVLKSGAIAATFISQIIWCAIYVRCHDLRTCMQAAIS